MEIKLPLNETINKSKYITTNDDDNGNFHKISLNFEYIKSTLLQKFNSKKVGLFIFLAVSIFLALTILKSKNITSKLPVYYTSFLKEKQVQSTIELKEDKKFIYKHTVIDTLEKSLMDELKYHNITYLHDNNGIKETVKHIKNIRRNTSKLPRTSDVKYNYLDPKKKYFLYSPSGGFNNQLISLIDGMTLARITNRVLIVPGNGKHSNMWKGFLRLKGNEIVPMDQTLDFHHMQKATGIEMMPINVTIDEFVAMYPPKTFKMISTPGTGLMMAKGQVYRKITNTAKDTTRQVAYVRGRFFTAHWLDKTYWQNARYAPYLQEMAASIASDFFKEDFNAIHIRLGDYTSRSMKFGNDATKYVQNAKKMGFKKEIPVYISSEEGRDLPYFKPLLDYFDKVVFQEELLSNIKVRKWLIDYTMRTPSTAVRNDLFGLIEQLVCARANNFLGTRISTFSKTIRVMRNKLEAAIPDLYQDLKYKYENGGNIPVRKTGLHRWAGPPDPSAKKDHLGIIPKKTKSPTTNITNKITSKKKKKG